MPPTIWDRTDLLAWLAGEAVPVRPDQSGDIPSGKMRVCWAEDDPSAGELPQQFVVPAGDQTEFLAWASTYLGGFRPLTSLARVLTPEAVSKLALPPRRPTLGTFDAAWVGAILGEVLESAGEPSGRSLSVRGCTSAFMFAAARTSAVWRQGELTDVSGRLWTRCRLVSRGSSPHSPLSLIREEAARSLESLRESPTNRGSLTDLLAACNDGTPSTALADGLARHDVSLPGLGEAFLGPREERIGALEGVIRRLQLARHIDLVERSLLLAVAFVAVGPGSLDYLDLATSLSSEFPGLVLWYGICAGLGGRTAVLSEFDGFGRKVLKELLFDERLGERPRCDIALAELEVLLGGHRMPRGWRAAQPGSMIVELLPTVYTTLRWPPQGEDFAGARADAHAVDRGEQLGLDFERGDAGRESAPKKRERRNKAKG